jgi:ethanolamine-phosphate phospho-lyase
LIDERGVTYLDTRNNVAHCGHCHPRIVQAIQHQQATLNTNTRYLHPTTSALAQRLTATFPSPLDTVFFVNSGSEANDLALRLAKIWAGGSNNTIVVENAYHGHTQATLDVSSCKFSKSKEYKLVTNGNSDSTSGPNGSASSSSSSSYLASTPGKHIYQVPCPDLYRGPYRDATNAGERYAQHVQDACDHYTRQGEKVRAFLFESGVSVGGAILPPKGYLPAAARAVRQAGGLYIADEVQTGFGRLGRCYWAFQYHDGTDLVPDIVTVGKAFGNGTPLAAVVTSRAVAAAFEACHVEYFNTFGGNPVSTTAGLAVMTVVEEEQLQQNALVVGAYLKDSFLALQEKVALIGDIRGGGFFIGVEFVKDRSTKEPAVLETSWLCSQLKQKYHILTSIDGPLQNILNFSESCRLRCCLFGRLVSPWYENTTTKCRATHGVQSQRC